jgi:GTP-binding protein EngB required for normal cell division
MQNLIPVLNKLQDVFATVGAHTVNLPQIVVVGCQSAGKSSVLEAIVGRDFLPRGAGICTRRPLILQLIHTEGRQQPRDYAEFLHAPGRRFTDFNQVRDEIDAETARVCGKNKGVTDKPIGLKVYSPDVLNLTMVDLPGLTKIAVEGQPADIAQQIEKMVESYIRPDNAIILAITPANQDLANSDSLIAARKVDPSGNRTVGVITKLDIMDKGTDARDVLLNRVYPLKLGYIGVVNRSQQDIVSRKTMAAANEAEKKFFLGLSAYRDIAENCGTQFLAITLNQLLMRHIKSKLPSLYAQINDLLAVKRRELQRYGAYVKTDTIEDREVILFSLISRYMEEWLALLHGTSERLGSKGLDGGSSLLSALIDDFPVDLLKIPSVKEEPEERVNNIMQNQDGLYRSMFFPEQSFHALVKVEIEKMRPCSLDAVDRVRKLLIELHRKLEVPELQRWNALHDGINVIAQDVIARCAAQCKAYVNNFLNVQRSFINTEHPDFRGKTREKKSMKDVQSLIELTHRYYIIIRKEVMDLVPKAIYRFMIERSTRELRLELVEKLVLPGSLMEDPQIADRRRVCAKLIDALEQAADVLTEVRKTHI